MATLTRAESKLGDFTEILDFHNSQLLSRQDAYGPDTGAGAGIGTDKLLNSPLPKPLPEPLPESTPESTPFPTASVAAENRPATANTATQSHSRDFAAGDEIGANGGASLGDFSKIFLFLGPSPEVPRSAANPDIPNVFATKDDYASDGAVGGATYAYSRRSSVHRSSVSSGTGGSDGEDQAGGVNDTPRTKSQRNRERKKKNKARKTQNEDMNLRKYLDRNHTGLVSESEIGSNFGGGKTPARKASSHVKSKDSIAAWNDACKSPQQHVANSKATEKSWKQQGKLPVQSPQQQRSKKTSASQGQPGAQHINDTTEYTPGDASGSPAVSAFSSEQFVSGATAAAAPATPSPVKGRGTSTFANPLARVARRLGLPEKDVRKSLGPMTPANNGIGSTKQAFDAGPDLQHGEAPTIASSSKLAPTTPVQPLNRPVTRSQTASGTHQLQPEPATHLPSFTPPPMQPQMTAPPPPRRNGGWVYPPAAIQPMVIRSGPDRHWALWTKLMDTFPEDFATLVSPARSATHNSNDSGIHIFVDASNIFIGFMDSLKAARNIHPSQRMPDVDLCFKSLSLVLERGRPIAKRVLGGSYPYTKAHHQAEDIGYEMCMLEKTMKARKYTERQLHFNQLEAQRKNAKAPLVNPGLSSPGYTMLNNTNGVPNGPSGAGTPAAPQYAPPKMVEQGVDEILHLKIVQSVAKWGVSGKPPGTIVLATGDAAAAEYSGGFKEQLETALEGGWKVELLSWKKNISQEYLKPAWILKWHPGQFRVIWLDPFAEELLDFEAPAGPSQV